MNKDFRMATLRDWIAQTPEIVIDFTRYDLEVQELADAKPWQPIRNCSQMNRLNQKGMRPKDEPMDIEELYPEEQKMIKRRYPVLLTKEHPQRKKTNYVFKSDYFKAGLFRKSCVSLNGINFYVAKKNKNNFLLYL